MNLRQLLLATTAIMPLVLSPGMAAAGGDDHFGGDETLGGSSFDNGSDTAGGVANNEGYSSNTNIDTLASYADGDGGVATYQVNPYHRTFQLVNISSDGYRGSGDQLRTTEGIGGGRSPRDVLAARAAREKPAPARRPTPTPSVVSEAAPPAPAYVEPPPVALPALPEMPTIQAPPIDIVPNQPAVQARQPDLEIKELERALRAVERAAVTPGEQDGKLNAKQQELARTVEDALGLGLGALAGGWFGGGLANDVLGAGKVARIAKALAPAEGAAIGFAKAELHDYHRVDSLIENMTEFTKEEMEKAKNFARRQPPEQRARIMDAVRDNTNRQEREERKEARREARQEARQNERQGGGKKGKGK